MAYIGLRIKLFSSKVCDPNNTQFEPFLVHFEQLRLIYETMKKDDDDA